MKLYHATSKNNLESIQNNGLSGDFTKVRPGSIHLAIDIFTAESYHQHWEDTDTLIYSIDTKDLDETLFGPDREDLMDILEQNDDDRDWSEVNWKESLKLCGNCTYSGIIPFEKLKLENTIESDLNNSLKI